LLYAHKLLAYAFLIVVIAHGGAYYVSNILYFAWTCTLTGRCVDIRCHICSSR
jgi:hypothetical protein